MSRPLLSDAPQRERAIDVTSSFIVQAPAGSGKTELLSLRYLNLLGRCQQPEEVLAITFTRKAAAEMRDRIIRALAWARRVQRGDGQAPTNALEQLRFDIAGRVVARDDELGWQLSQNPNRLRIQTIDSFCYHLASQLPLQSSLGGGAAISTDVEACFSDAISNMLAALDRDEPLADDIAVLLTHLDNNVSAVERMLVGLLHSREQWLSYILDINRANDTARHYLEETLVELIYESIARVAEGLAPHEGDLVSSLNFAMVNLRKSNPDDARYENFAIMQTLPPIDPPSLADWQRLADLLLTQTGEWRKPGGVNVKAGFPTGKDEPAPERDRCETHKNRFKALLEALADDGELMSAVAYLRLLPRPDFADGQWRFLSSLTRVLHALNGQLLLSFRRFRLVDHTQTSLAASEALGSGDDPSDLLLQLDHQLSHILVDEFQDTSRLQLDMLEKLTAGWQSGDGRTLFLVGDAMQSCYGFRNANVGIYLHVWEHGLGQLELETLTLDANFRSRPEVVDWVNRVFTGAFPVRADASRGAVPYTASVSQQEASTAAGVRAEFITCDNEPECRARAQQVEAEHVVAHLFELRERAPDASIAILVRSRPHLQEIIRALKQANQQWRAADIDPLDSLPLIEDLLTLVKAVLNLSDRLSWLALLRAPWCGLTLPDLLAIQRLSAGGSIWSALTRLDELHDLSDDGLSRARALHDALLPAIASRLRIDLRELIEACWQRLGGQRLTQDPIELRSVQRFFELLGEHSAGQGLSDPFEFEKQLHKAYVPASQDRTEASGTLHILTMHKAKGLEFDHVIIPGLARTTRSDDKPLLHWHERLNEAGQSRLFLAALSPVGSDDDPLYQLLRHELRCKAELEATRLLYIAITRARESVLLLGCLAHDPRKDPKPPGNSLLGRIWEPLDEQVPQTIQCLPITALGSTVTSGLPARTPIHRLRVPPTPEAITEAPIDDDVAESPREQAAARAGTLVHEFLEAAVRRGTWKLEAEREARLRQYWQQQMARILPPGNELDAAVAFIGEAVRKALDDGANAWVFDAQQQDSRCELALSLQTDTGVRNYVVDRSFIDRDGVRWIIDYKTAPYFGTDSDTFIAQQSELYRGQLARYRELFEAESPGQPIKTALYFTTLPALVEIT